MIFGLIVIVFALIFYIAWFGNVSERELEKEREIERKFEENTWNMK